jgi:hypothetical protein
MADGNGRRPKLRDLVRSARDQIEDLTGRRVASVLGLERTDDNGWEMTIEVFELERIPETTSIMGCYRLELDEDGDVVEYHRVRRYNRSTPDEDR